MDINHSTEGEPARARSWRQAQQILELLSSLSYQADQLNEYLQQIACGVSQLIGLDWSVVTVCQDGQERVMASSIPLSDGEHVYSLHGLLTETVMKTGCSLTVEDTQRTPEYGMPPEGYFSYLGVPLRTPKGEVIGTICSFHGQPRKFFTEEVHTVELFAERAATAIENFRLYQQQKQFNQRLEAEVVRQTTALKAAQEQLIEQERLAAVGQFAAMIVHEIRNPMTTIRMGLNYFKKTQLAAPAQERLSLSLEEVARLENLLNEILLYAKPQVLQLSELDVNALVESTLPLLREMPEAVDRTIQFVPLQPSACVKGDKDKLKQVLINLVKNACEATAPGEVVTCQVGQDLPTHHIYLQVHNSGLPIPPDLLPKLTQPFCSTKPGGTGLGLAIVQRIVDAHAGKLLIQSDQASGTTIRVMLPIAQ
jgi:signal transduction histidine kinase